MVPVMPEWDLTPERPTVRTPESRAYGGYTSLSDPATAVLLGGGLNFSGEYVSEQSILSLSGVYRALSLISQTIAALVLKTFRELDDESRVREKSFLDDPAGAADTVVMTPFQWKETVVLHLLLRGESDLLHVRNQAGALVGAIPVHPAGVAVYGDRNIRGGERYVVSLDDGTNLNLTPYGNTPDDPGMTRILGPRTRGLRGWSPLTVGATAFGIGLAAERATARMFSNGLMTQGVLTPAQGEDLSADDATALRNDLDRHVFGNSNAGTVPLVNRVLQFNAWQMSNVDAQFMETRQFQIEEVSRFLGVPPHLLMALEKTTSWGTGIAENNKNLQQYVLSPWCKRIEERLSKLLPQPRWVEFDMAGLLAGSAAEESALLLSEVNGGLRTLNEARRIKNLPPLPGGDELRIPSGVMLQAQLSAAVALTDAKADQADAAASAALPETGAPDGAANA